MSDVPEGLEYRVCVLKELIGLYWISRMLLVVSVIQFSSLYCFFGILPG